MHVGGWPGEGEVKCKGVDVAGRERCEYLRKRSYQESKRMVDMVELHKGASGSVL